MPWRPLAASPQMFFTSSTPIARSFVFNLKRKARTNQNHLPRKQSAYLQPCKSQTTVSHQPIPEYLYRTLPDRKAANPKQPQRFEFDEGQILSGGGGGGGLGRSPILGSWASWSKGLPILLVLSIFVSPDLWVEALLSGVHHGCSGV